MSGVNVIGMDSQRGSALIMVMAVLLIVSLVGVGLLYQSRLDTRFTSAMGSSDHSFGLSDGALSVAMDKIPATLEDQTYDGSVLIMNFVKYPSSPPYTPGYTSSGFMKGIRTGRSSGYGLGEYYDQLWLTQGDGRSSGVTTITNAAVEKKDKGRYGDY